MSTPVSSTAMSLVRPLTVATMRRARRPGVVVYDGRPHQPLDEHARVTLEHLGARLAYVRDYDYLGHFQPRHGRRPLYFVPRDTLLVDEARALGIDSRDDFFGGIVPYPVLQTKAIAHPLVDDTAMAPAGWCPALGARLAPVTLPGYAAFSKGDARRAALLLLARGAVRLKAGAGVGGLGQWPVNDEHELDAVLDGLEEAAVNDTGLVVEINLRRSLTYGVGQLHLGERVYSYFGTQRSTRNHAGKDVYAGSDLQVVRGDFDALLAVKCSPDVKLAIRQAKAFDAAVRASFAGLLVTRNNYDVIQGCDCADRPHSGVLDQSWRIGGASPAEIAAIEAFDHDPALRLVRVSTIEHYGAIEPPHHARIHYSGVDPRVGQITKYTLVDADEHAAAVVYHPG